MLIYHDGSTVPFLASVFDKPIFVDPQQTLQFDLLGGFNHLETYESQWEGLSHIYPYIMENTIHV